MLRSDFICQMKMAELNDIELRCVVAIHGIHGPIRFKCSKSQWRDMDLQEKLRASQSVIITAPKIFIYEGVHGHWTKEHCFAVESFSKMTTALIEDVRKIVDGKGVICSLSSAVWLRDFIDCEFHCAGGIIFECKHSGARPFISQPELNQNILQVCDELRALLTGDRVFEDVRELEAQMLSLHVSHGIDSNLLQKVDSLSSMVADMGPMYYDILSKINVVFQKLMPTMLGSTLDFSMLFLDFLYAIIHNVHYLMVSCAIRLCNKLGILEHCALQLVAFISEKLNIPKQVREEDVYQDAMEAQGFSSISLEQILVAFIGVVILQNMPSMGDIGKVMNNLRMYNLLLPTGASVVALLQHLPKFLPEVVGKWFSFLCPEKEWVDELPHFEAFVDAVFDLTQQRNEDVIKYDTELRAKLADLQVQALKYMKLGGSCKDFSPKLYSLLTNLAKRLDKFQEIVDVTGTGRARRKEPFSIGIVGTSDIGKSHFVATLAAILAPDDMRNNLVYTRTANNEFWDGYTKQFCVCYDDFGQIVESEDFGELFSVINSVQYIPPMASLDSVATGKKGTYFDSKLVVLTSNTHFPPCRNSIRTPEALYRRRRMLWEAEVRPCYKVNGRVVWDQIPQEVLKEYGHLVWRECDPMPLGSEGVHRYDNHWITTSDMLVRVMAAYRRFQAREERGLADYMNAEFINRMRGQNEQYFDVGERVLEGQGVLSELEKYTGVVKKEFNSWREVVEFSTLTVLLKERIEQWKIAHPTIWACISWFFDSAWLITLGSVLGYAICALLGTDFKDYELHGSPNYDSASKVRKGRTKMRVAQGAVEPVEKALNSNFDLQLYNNFAPAMLTITVMFDDGTVNRMCGFAFGYDLLLVPRHLFLDPEGDPVKDGTLVEAEMASGVKYKGLFRSSNLRILQANGRNKDVAVYRFGPTMRSFRCRINNFVDEGNVGVVVNSRGVLISCRNRFPVVHYLSKIGELSAVSRYKIGAKWIHLLNGWEYGCPTVKGDCGSLVCSDSNNACTIVGIHIAGEPHSEIGVAEVVTRQQLEEVVKDFLFLVEGLPSPSNKINCELEPRLVTAHGNFEIIGTVMPEERVRLPQVSSIVKSPFFEMWDEHRTEPAVLVPSDPRLAFPLSPLEKGIAKYGQPCSPFDYDLLEDIKLDIIQELWPQRKLQVFPEFVAINGLPGVDGVDSMNFQSSAGWPFKTYMPPGVSKEWLFGGEIGERYVRDPTLRNRLDLRLASAKLGKRFPSAFLDCLKDERRSLEKISSGSTRIFANAPVDFVILLREYTLDFAAHFYSLRHSSFSAVGVNCASFEWASMYEYLAANSDIGFAGDFSRFDGTLSADCMYIVCQLINMAYNDSDENRIVRHVLFNELIHTVHIALDMAYVCSGGNPSGNPLTVVLNTIVNEIYLRYTWLKIAPAEMANLVSYHENVKTKIYGDDNWVSVSRDAIGFYNMQTVGRFLATMGITYVPPWKEATEIEYLPLIEWSFLKHKCHLVPEISEKRYLAAMEWDVVLEMMYWSHKNLEPFEAMEQTAGCALRFAFGHGKLRFNWLRERLVDAFRKEFKKVPALVSWRELRSEFLKNNGFLTYRKLECQGDVGQVQDDTQTNLNVSSIHGIVQAEQGSVVLQESGAGEMSVERLRAEAALSDKVWSFEEILDRYIRIDSYEWRTAHPVGTSLAVLNVPANLILANCSNFIPFTMFKYWRGNVHLRFQLNGTRFHAGRLIAFFCPQMNATDVATWHVANKAASTTVTHLFLDPVASTVAELVIPFQYLLNYLPIMSDGINEAPYADVGIVVLNVFNQLAAAAGVSTSLFVTLSVRFTQTQLKIPIDNHMPALMLRQSELNKRDIVVRERDMQAQGNTISNKAYNVIQRASNVTIPTEVTGDKFDVKSKVSGMDKVNIGTQPVYFVRKPLGYINHSNNPEMLQKLSLDPSAQNVVDFEHFGVERDEMALSYVLRLPTYSQNTFFTWSAADVTGAMKLQWPIGPLGSIPNSIPVSAADYTWYPTLWEEACIPFTFWRGDIVIKFDIVASAFHTGKLWVSVNYGMVETIPPAALVYHKYGVALDLNAENHHYEVRIPFLSNTEWKRVYNGHSGISNYRMQLMDFFVGTVVVTVMNPLVHPDNVPTSVDVNTFICGGDNFEVSCLAMNNCSWRQLDGQGSTDLANTMSIGLKNDNMMTIGNISGPVVLNDKHFGESYLSVRDVVRRYGMAMQLVEYVRSRFTYSLPPGTSSPHYWMMESSFSIHQLISASHVQWWASMYRVWRGSMRAKIIPHINMQQFETIAGVRYVRQLPDMKYWIYFDANPNIEMANLGEGQATLGANPTNVTTMEDRYQCFNLMEFPVSDVFGVNAQTSNFQMQTIAGVATGTNYACQNTIGSIPVYPNGAFGGGGVKRAPPGEIFDLRAAYSEVEIPFQTHYSTLFTLAASNDFGSVTDGFRNAVSSKWHSSGMIYINRFASPNEVSGNDTVFGARTVYNVMASVGDDFRLGMLMGPHKLTFISISQNDVFTGVTTYHCMPFDYYTCT